MQLQSATPCRPLGKPNCRSADVIKTSKSLELLHFALACNCTHLTFPLLDMQPLVAIHLWLLCLQWWHACLQLLEINLVTNPQVADAILANGTLTYYDRPRIAQVGPQCIELY